jgi:hypothetical protein
MTVFLLNFPIKNGILGCQLKSGGLQMRKVGLRFNIKFCYLLLAIMGLLVLLSPSHVLAQDRKDGLILRDVTGGYNNEVVPGESKTFFAEVANDSNSSTNNIRFAYDAPKEWLVEFKPQSIDTLNAGSYQTVEVSITAPQNAKKGNYSVTVIADSNVGRRAMGIYLRVEKGTNLWMWVGGVLGVMVITMFVVIFRRFGRD